MPSFLKLLNVKNIKMVLRNILRVGPVNTIRYIVSDLMFDYKYKVATIDTKMLDALEINSPNKDHGHYYEGTNAYIFNNVFSHVDIDTLSSCFVDFGSGKGKAMFLAAEKGFQKVIGVEFSIELVETCRKNLEIFKRNSNNKTEFEIIHMDAASYKIPPTANFLYFANPFDEVLIEKVIVNIFESMKQSPRDIIVIHLHPQGNMAFANHPKFYIEYEDSDVYILRLSPDK